MVTVEGYALPDDRGYDAREHVWVLVEAEATGGDGVDVRIGIDALGAELLGEVVYVELTPAGRDVKRGDVLGSLEAEKMVRPLLAPVSGRLLEVNEAVGRDPGLVNRDPYQAGWLVRIRASRWGEERDGLLFGERARAWARAEIEASRR